MEYILLLFQAGIFFCGYLFRKIQENHKKEIGHFVAWYNDQIKEDDPYYMISEDTLQEYFNQ